MKSKGRSIRKIITFIGSFIAALSVVAQFFPGAFSFLEDIPSLDKIVFICVVVMMLALFILNWKHNLEENDAKFKLEHEVFHRYAHLLRDTTYEIDKIANDGANNTAINQLLVSFSNAVALCVKENLDVLLNADPAKNKLMVSVKLLDYEYWNNSLIPDKSAATVKTVSRSETAKGALQADDAVSHPISEYTALQAVFVDGRHDWSGFRLCSKRNLEIVSEDYSKVGIAYRDSCPTWNEYYENRIVVPIRVKLSEIDDAYLNSDERNLFGFLCVEYKDSKLLRISDKFDEDLISILDLMKTYADTMYTVYDTAFRHMKLGNPVTQEG